MPFVLTYTSKVRQALKAPTNIGVDALLIVGVAGLIAAIAKLFGHVATTRPEAVQIKLSLTALPLYTLYSLGRGFAAYAISLIFTLIYGSIAAHNRSAEKLMIPTLDVLQSLPVLSFLPALVLFFVHLFPVTWLGLELACVIMIFTAQAWNMTFSYYGSVKSIPPTLREAAEVQHLSAAQCFRYLELPASMIGLVWNSMMSMAGGWFIITVNEAFTLHGQDYRLPGLGSYMNEALIKWNVPAMVAGVVAMILMIIFVDQIFWRPIVVWSQRFKLEDTAATDQPTSWMLTLFNHSRVLKWIEKALDRRREALMARAVASAAKAASEDVGSGKLIHRPPLIPPAARSVIRWLVVLGLLASSLWGVYVLGRLVLQLPLREHGDDKGWTSIVIALLFSFFRVMTAVVLGGLWTLPVGVLIGLSPKWSNRLQPVVQVVASFPAPMVFPLAILILLALHIPFTIGCIGLMLLGTQWYVLFNVIAGAMAIPSELREAGSVYHLSSLQRWRRIYIPSVFPYLVTGLITAAGGAWNATIVSEILAVPHANGSSTTYEAYGIGSIITDATSAGNYPLLAASVVTMGVAVVIINRLIWKRIYRIAEERYSLNV